MHLTFDEVVTLSRNRIVAGLIQQAIVADGIAKATCAARARRQIYAQRNAALSRLIALKVAKVDNTVPDRRLISLLLPGRPMHCLRVPLDVLTPDAQRERAHAF